MAPCREGEQGSEKHNFSTGSSFGILLGLEVLFTAPILIKESSFASLASCKMEYPLRGSSV